MIVKSRLYILFTIVSVASLLFPYCANIKVDINNIDTPDGNWIVLVNGSWNSWNWGTELYDNDGDNIFEGSICDLENGTYGYVHTITGEFDNWSGWGMVSNAPYNSSCDFVPNDQWMNYGFEIYNQDYVGQINSWGGCGVEAPDIPIESILKPVNGSILNYIYIPFEWTQFPDAIGYNIKVSNSETFDSLVLDHFSNRTLYIAEQGFEWDTTYYWKIQPVYSNGDLGEFTDVAEFSIGRQEFDLSANILTDDNFLYEYTVFGDWNNYRTSIVDINGKEVWNSGGLPFMMNHVSEYGQLFGGRPNLNGVEVDYNQQVVWQSNQWLDQHEFKQISNGNYMGFIYEQELGPIPIGDWTSSFQALGYQADGVTNEFPYGAQIIVEFDAVTKEQVWSWNPHEYYTKLDSDLYGGTWWGSFAGTNHDWTHSNAFYFDEQESAVYISSRHLSRITKINYPSGEVDWMMGLPSEFMFSGDSHICTDLEFSFQHNIQRLDNGNLLFFDNGNLDYLFGNEMTSRALEVEVVDGQYCNIVWEYVLPPELAAYGMGSVQSLENGNYLINTTGGGGTVLEVTREGDIAWSLNLGLTWPNGSGYRAYRVPSIHPGAFSVMGHNFSAITYQGQQYDALITNNENTIAFTIYNHSGYSQWYDYTVQELDDEASSQSSGVFIDAESYSVISFEPSFENSDLLTLKLVVKPRYHANDERVFQFNTYKDTSYIVGDANLDGEVNILDCILIVNFILDNIEPLDAQAQLSDINSDGSLNILDIIDLINLIVI